MEKISEKFIKVQSKAHFRSNTYINLETTDVKKKLSQVIYLILEKISIYQQSGSGCILKNYFILKYTLLNINR